MNKDINQYCYGCGAKLQSDDINEIGYVKKLNNDEMMLCLRCYRSIHHHEYKKINLDRAYFEKLINDNVTRKNLIILVIDLFDINSSLNDEVLKYFKNNQILIVANKRDLILKNVNERKIIAYVKKIAAQYSDNILGVIVTSSQKKYHIDELLSKIYEYHNQHHVYMVGLSNVGKSSLINALLNSQSINEQLITVSNYPNTTLDMIEIALSKDVSLIDMPGLLYSGQMINYLKNEDLKFIETKKEIKSRTYQLMSMQSVFIGGLVCFSYLKGSQKGFTFFFNNPLMLHRTKYENSINLFDTHEEDDLLIPRALNVNFFADFVTNTIIIDEEKKYDIIICGLGWISFNGHIGDEIMLALPAHVKYIVKEAFI
ncbi:MAG: ribosome biogenesis GTPase YqeH [Bacilli bacterium]|jgi:ribosome biogenesis GTPase YqeH|nr:ribosome biogenesis GTPase YqeH [Bacilli bacterium]